MGKTKTKLIDDSQPTAEVKKTSQPKDALVEKLKAELGIENETVDDRKSKIEAEGGESKMEEKSIKPSSILKKPSSTIDHPSSKKVRSKKYQEKVQDLDKSKQYSLNEAVELIKKSSYSKFDGTLEAHVNTDKTGIRGLVSLPFASGKKLRILAFEGDDETIEQISKGKVDFDLVVTTPQWMPKLTKVARILGPRGLMPNPKNGTITDDLKKAVEGFQAGKTEYKTEPKAAVIHLGLGKLTQPTEELSANVKTLLQVLGKTRVKKVSLSPTMGPSVKLDLSSI